MRLSKWHKLSAINDKSEIRTQCSHICISLYPLFILWTCHFVFLINIIVCELTEIIKPLRYNCVTNTYIFNYCNICIQLPMMMVIFFQFMQLTLYLNYLTSSIFTSIPALADEKAYMFTIIQRCFCAYALPLHSAGLLVLHLYE